MRERDYRAPRCKCGHMAGDHASAGTSWPHSSTRGVCLQACSCVEFDEERGIPTRAELAELEGHIEVLSRMAGERRDFMDRFDGGDASRIEALEAEVKRLRADLASLDEQNIMHQDYLRHIAAENIMMVARGLALEAIERSR